MSRLGWIVLSVVDGALIAYKVHLVMTYPVDRFITALFALDATAWVGVLGYAWRIRFGRARWWTVIRWAYLLVTALLVVGGTVMLYVFSTPEWYERVGIPLPDEPMLYTLFSLWFLGGITVAYRLLKAAGLYRYTHRAPELWGRRPAERRVQA
jgi:hypothetical protein